MRACWLVLVVACGGPRTVGGPIESTTRPARTPTAHAIAGYPDPVEPPPAACALRGHWAYEEPHELRFREGDPPFATLNEVKDAALSLSQGGPFAELDNGEVRVWGFVARDQLLLHAAKPLLVAGFLAPGPSAVLHWLDASAAGVSFEVATHGDIRTAAPVRGVAPCDSLSIQDDAKFDARDAIPEVAQRTAMLPDQQPVPVSTEPGSPPVAWLEYEKGDAPVIDVLDTRGDAVRVAVQMHWMDPLKNLVVVGWVPGTSVRPTPSHGVGYGGSWASGGGGHALGHRPRAETRHVRCTHEVPLVGELGNERHLIGELASGVEIEILPGDGELVPIVDGRHEDLNMADGARLLVKRSAVADCADATPGQNAGTSTTP
jgi:hypothetical protein